MPYPVSWLIHRERLLLLGWGRAILLQFAHPLVAQAVWDHSGFRLERFGGWRRLNRTLHAMLSLTFGSASESRAAASRINAIHARVRGLSGAVPYSARDPELLRWVHVTCVDSFMRTYEAYVQPLAEAQRDAYCAESAAGAACLGLDPASLPQDSRRLQDDLDGMYASGSLRITDTARMLARAVLYAEPRWLGWPFVAAARLSTLGLLPPVVRAEYGFPWRRRDERRFAAFVRCVTIGRGLMPGVAAHWPMARRAMSRRAASAAPRAGSTPML
jgi:uncharacterized protein (DUF2236 family)